MIMQTKQSDLCPRCGGPLFVSTDQNFGACLNCGDQYIGPPPPEYAKELQSKPVRRGGVNPPGYDRQYYLTVTKPKRLAQRVGRLEKA